MRVVVINHLKPTCKLSESSRGGISKLEPGGRRHGGYERILFLLVRKEELEQSRGFLLGREADGDGEKELDTWGGNAYGATRKAGWTW